MRETMSNNLCEAPRKMQIRDECRTSPRWSANLWLDRVKLKLWKVESVCEASKCITISKRQYGMETDGKPVGCHDRLKSNQCPCEGLWLIGYKPSTSVGGARSEKMGRQIRQDLNKTSHPDLSRADSFGDVVKHNTEQFPFCWDQGHKLWHDVSRSACAS